MTESDPFMDSLSPGDEVPIPNLLFVLSQNSRLLPLRTPPVPVITTCPAEILLPVSDPEILRTLRRLVVLLKVKLELAPKLPPSLN